MYDKQYAKRKEGSRQDPEEVSQKGDAEERGPARKTDNVIGCGRDEEEGEPRAPRLVIRATQTT